MAVTNIRGSQILNNTVQRQDLDVSTVGQALVTKLIQGTGITLSSTGADAGTGDVTVSAGTNVRPVILGETAADSVFTSGIVVPRYTNHPDAIWTYGAFDDHFDAGSVNAKWVQTVSAGGGVSQAGSQLNVSQASQAASATVYETSVVQSLPATATHTLTLKLLSALFPFGSAGSWVNFFLNSEYGARAGGFNLQWIQQVSGSQNVSSIQTFVGAGFGTSLFTYYAARIPNYWRFVYDSGKSTTIQFSNDGITWVNLTSATGAQTGFATNAPSQFRIGVQAIQLSVGFAQVDWIKHV